MTAKYGGKEHKFPEGTTTLKHVTPTQFMWASYDKDGKVWRTAGGGYTIQGTVYEETPEYGMSYGLQDHQGEGPDVHVEARREQVAPHRQAQQRADHRRGVGAGREEVTAYRPTAAGWHLADSPPRESKPGAVVFSRLACRDRSTRRRSRKKLKLPDAFRPAASHGG